MFLVTFKPVDASSAASGDACLRKGGGCIMGSGNSKGMIRRLAVLLGSAALLLPLAEPMGQRSGAVARFLLAMAATTMATPAQAQTTCTAPDFQADGRRQIWTGTLTVGFVNTHGFGIYYGFDSDTNPVEANVQEPGSLDDTTFTINSQDYTITKVEVLDAGQNEDDTVVANEGQLEFHLGPLPSPALEGTVKNELQLHVCDTAYDFNDATNTRGLIGRPTTRFFIWSDAGLDWSGETERTLYLSLPANRTPIAPTISSTGGAQVGDSLTVDPSTIMDADGLPDLLEPDNVCRESCQFPAPETPANFTYQWIREDEDGSNPVEITDATSTTYRLTDDDLGKRIKVQVTFTDLLGTEETVESIWPSSGVVTQFVCTEPNLGTRRPIWSGTLTPAERSGTAEYGYHAESGTGILSPAEFSIGPTDFNIRYIESRAAVPNTPNLLRVFMNPRLTETQNNALRLHVCDVEFELSDGRSRGSSILQWEPSNQSWSDGVARSLVLSAPADTPATGMPTITHTGTGVPGDILTADTTAIMDADGLPDSFNYQWIRADAGGSNPADILGQTMSTYTMTADDVGKWLQVRVEFFDILGTEEELLSDAWIDGDTVAGSATPANTPPTVATSIPGQTVTVGQSFDFMVPAGTFSDADTGDTLTYEATLADDTPLPGWLTFNEMTQTFTGMPGAGDVGTLTVRVTATDGSGESVFDDFMITAEAETMVVEPMPAACPAPDFQAEGRRQIWTGEVTVGSLTTANETEYGFSSDAGGLDNTMFSINGRTRTIQKLLVLSAPGDSLRDGDLSFEVQGTEELTSVEIASLRLHVCDTNSYNFSDALPNTNNTRFQWNNGPDWSTATGTMRTLYLSLPENRPATGLPTITSSDGGNVGAVLTAGTGDVMDEDGVPDMFTYQWIRQGEPITGEMSNTYTLTAADMDQRLQVQVSFTDQLGNEETVESLTWIGGSLNNAPTGADKTVTVMEDETYTFAVADFEFMDMDGDTLDHVVIVTLPATGDLREGPPLNPMQQMDFPDFTNPLAMVGSISLTDIEDNYLTYTPPDDENGTGYASFTFKVSDGKDESDEYTMTIDVTPVADEPRLMTEIVDQTATVNEPFRFTILGRTFIDGDGDTLTYAATLADGTALPVWLTFNTMTQTFTGTPTTAETLMVKVTVTSPDSDPDNEVSDEFDIVVSEMMMNAAPTAADNTVTVNEDETYTFTAADFGFNDTDGDTLDHVVVVTLPATDKGVLQLNDVAVTQDQQITRAELVGTGLTYTPPADANGMGYASFTFRVNDSKDDSVDDYTITINVTAMNNAPTVANEIPDQTATVGEPFEFMIPANTFEDADTGDTLTYAATLEDGTALPSSWLTFNVTNQTFEGTPTAAETLMVQVTATDGSSAPVSDMFDIMVMVAPVPGNGATGGSTPGGSTPGVGTPGVGTPEDTAGVSLSTAMLTVSEGSSGVYTVTLNTDPDGPVTITPTSGDGGAVGVSPASLTFTTSDWDMAQTVTVTGVEDDDANNETVTIRHSVSGDGSVTAAGAVTVTVTDTDTAGVSVSPARVSTAEGEAATYTLVLDTLPDGPVTITPTSADNGAVSVSPASLTFTTSDWDMSQTVTVTGVQDDDANGETVTIRHRVSGYGSVTAADVTVNVADDDTAGVSVSPTRVSTTEGEAATYTLVLDTLPDGPVTITPTSGDSGAVSVSPASLTFTPSNWDTAQTVTVTGVQDDDGANETVTISHSVSGYGAVTAAGAVTVTVAEDEAAQEAKAVLEEVALPEVLQQVTARTTEVIASRLNSIASGSSGAPVTLSLEDVVADTVAFFHGEREQLKNGSLEWQEALAGRSFALPLSGLNLAQGESGVSGQEDLFSSLAVWGSGDYTSYGNTIAGTDVDGNGFSGAIGIDLQPMPRLVTGLALTTSRWGLDYTTNTDGSSEAGTYEIGVTTVNPYVNWSATDQLSLWATFGYGRGEVEQTPEGGTADAQTDDLTSWAGGLRFEAIPAVDAPTGEGSPFALAFKVDGAASSFLDTDVQLARLAAEVSRSFTVETGLLTTTLELGWSIRSVSDQDDLDETRKRIADKNDGGGAELAGRLHWLNADSSMSAAVDTRVLLGGGDRREWGIGGQLRLTPSKRDGEGLSLTLQPAFGVTGTKLDELWSLSGDGDLAISNDRPGGRLDAELAYGFRHGDALFTPYTEVMLEETASTYGAGLRYGLNPFLELDLKGAHRSRANGDDENRLFLQVYSDL